MSNLTNFAESELRRAGLFDKGSDYGGMLGPAVLRMVEVFAAEGHSGFSASMALAAFQKLACFEPLTPITGEDDEWGEAFDEAGTQQNKRCGRVFRNADGSAYDIEGKVFRTPSGACYTGRGGFVPVTFPYTPKTEYVDVPE